jgi:hypothetical protein
MICNRKIVKIGYISDFFQHRRLVVSTNRRRGALILVCDFVVMISFNYPHNLVYILSLFGIISEDIYRFLRCV